jgi:hypothetical protein
MTRIPPGEAVFKLNEGNEDVLRQLLKLADTLRYPKVFQDAVPFREPDLPRVPLLVRSPGPIPPGQERLINVFPYVAFRAEALFVFEQSWPLEMTPLVVGVVPAAAGDASRVFPCAAFKEWKRYDLDWRSPACMLSVRVHNPTKGALDFFAMLFGPYDDGRGVAREMAR